MERLSPEFQKQITEFTLRHLNQDLETLKVALEILYRLKPQTSEVLTALANLKNENAFVNALIIQTRWRNGAVKTRDEVEQIVPLTRLHLEDLLIDLSPVRQWISLELADQVFEFCHELWSVPFEFWLIAPRLPARVWSAIQGDFKRTLEIRRTVGGMKVVNFEDQFLAALLIAERKDSPVADIDRAFAILRRGIPALFQSHFYSKVERVLARSENPRLHALLNDLHNSPPARYRAERERLQQMKTECSDLLKVANSTPRA